MESSLRIHTHKHTDTQDTCTETQKHTHTVSLSSIGHELVFYFRVILTNLYDSCQLPQYRRISEVDIPS